VWADQTSIRGRGGERGNGDLISVPSTRGVIDMVSCDSRSSDHLSVRESGQTEKEEERNSQLHS
jgi:hypothetical protein